MAVTAVHQFVPWLEPGATGSHTLQLQALLRDLGYESEIFTEKMIGPMVGRARSFREFGSRTRPDTLLVYQFGIGSIVADDLLRREEPLLVHFHNITPAEFFDAWEPGLGHGSAWGRAQLPALARRSAGGVALSRYSERELTAGGFRRTDVAPFLFDAAELASGSDPVVEAALRAERQRTGGAMWVFVGRIAPNKAQHDLLKAFAVYRRVFDPGATLHLVGSEASPAYTEALEALRDGFGLGGAVHLCGAVDDAAKVAHYRAADVFVCLSDHEGFLVPLLEAWANDLPAVAYAAGAVPETMGRGGLLLRDKRPALVAAAVHRVVTDTAVREHLVAAGRARLGELSLQRARDRHADIVRSYVDAVGPA